MLPNESGSQYTPIYQCGQTTAAKKELKVEMSLSWEEEIQNLESQVTELWLLVQLPAQFKGKSGLIHLMEYLWLGTLKLHAAS